MDPSNFDVICRTCLKQGALRSLFLEHKRYSKRFSEMLGYCASLKVDADDNLPKNICKRCVTILTTLYKFKQNILDNDRKLRKIAAGEATGAKILANVKSETLDVDYKNSEPQDYYDKKYIHFLADCGNEAINTCGAQAELVDQTYELKAAKQSAQKDEIDDQLPDRSKNLVGLYDDAVTNPIYGQGQKSRLSKKYQCEVCGKILSCHSNLVQHIRHHTGEKPYGCDLCEKKFARAEHLNIHRRIHTGERPHSCSICSKRFVQFAALKAHLRIHSGERPHTCTICGKSFGQSVSLTYHTRTHTGETPFKCSICNKGFAHSGNLNIHMRFHLNERPFACNMCPRRFVTSSHLTVHVKQHNGDKSHKCKTCGKAFVRGEHLKDHLVIHTGEKPHACRLCPKRYTQSSHLNRHMKTHRRVPALLTL